MRTLFRKIRIEVKLVAFWLITSLTIFWVTPYIRDTSWFKIEPGLTEKNPIVTLTPEIKDWKIISDNMKGRAIVKLPSNEIVIRYFDTQLLTTAQLYDQIKYIDYPGAKADEEYQTVRGTCYNVQSNQTDSSPFVTADGFKINKKHPFKDKVLAMSRDMLTNCGGGPFTFGDTVMVKGTWVYDGKWVVHDTSADTVHFLGKHLPVRNTIDFLVDDKMYMNNWPKIQVSSLK
jgi:hypothetical protein